MITRHFIDIGSGDSARRVHYRRYGEGPPLLMVHQSPRSSAEYSELMLKWGQHFTCIAPDTPGFGQSDALTGAPDIDDFADAAIAFLDALGIEKTAAYGFHSGAIILVTAIKRNPERFSTFAAGGYAIWTPEEMEIFGESYLPPFQPSVYGEHLTWLWNRVLEQTWFFPWFDIRDAARLSMAHDDSGKVDGTVQDMLASGDAYRAGYGAVLRAPRDIPAVDAPTPPTLITAYDGDPLQAHIARLGDMPPNWSARAVETPLAHQQASLTHLMEVDMPALPTLPECADEGFAYVATDSFSGLIHWRGNPDAERLGIHAAGRASSLLQDDKGLFIDLPGHGLSDDWARPAGLDEWAEIIAAAAEAIGAAPQIIMGEGASYLLTPAVAALLEVGLIGGFDVAIPTDREQYAKRALPPVTPDRHGLYLTRAWDIVRAGHMFFPWYDARIGAALPVDEATLTPEALAAEHLALMQARRGPQLLRALMEDGPDNILRGAPPTAFMRVPDWAQARNDIWTPREIV